MLLLIKITFCILSQNKEQNLTFSIINLCSEVIRKLELSALSLGSLCAFYQGLAEELEGDYELGSCSASVPRLGGHSALCGNRHVPPSPCPAPLGASPFPCPSSTPLFSTGTASGSSSHLYCSMFLTVLWPSPTLILSFFFLSLF